MPRPRVSSVELSKKERKALDAMTKSIVNKIIHNPVVHLKKDANKVEGDRYVDTVRTLFDLDSIKEETKSRAGGDDE